MSNSSVQHQAAQTKIDNLKLAQNVFETYSKSMLTLVDELDNNFNTAVDTLLKTTGRVIITGMGKSGIIAKKIAATLASTGTKSFFVHAGEAFHGDLGMIDPDDVVILISYSGETDEVVKLLPSLGRNGNKTICIVGDTTSTLAKHADIVLQASIEREVCPNNLAPTTSTLVTLAMGDALAVCLMLNKNFKSDDFAQYHPGGSLGRRLLTRVKDDMRTADLPFISPDSCIRDVIWAMTRGRLGLALVVKDRKLCGVITDGDLRRAMVSEQDFQNLNAMDIATKDPITISSEAMLAEAEDRMHHEKINILVVENNAGQVEGVIQIFK